MTRIGLLLALVVLLSGCGARGPDTRPTPPTSGSPTASVWPVALDIPAIGVHITQLPSTGPGTQGDDQCPADPQVVIWNSEETAPGEPGLAELTASSQGAFQRLSDLSADDLIAVNLSDGTRATFKKNAPPPEQGEPSASLVLKACGGPAPVTAFVGRVS